MPRIAPAAAAFALLAFPLAASAETPPAHRSAADAPTEPLAELITGAGPSDVKPKDPPPQKGLIVPAVQKATEDPAAPLEVIVKRAPWTAKAKAK